MHLNFNATRSLKTSNIMHEVKQITSLSIMLSKQCHLPVQSDTIKGVLRHGRLHCYFFTNYTS